MDQFECIKEMGKVSHDAIKVEDQVSHDHKIHQDQVIHKPKVLQEEVCYDPKGVPGPNHELIWNNNSILHRKTEGRRCSYSPNCSMFRLKELKIFRFKMIYFCAMVWSIVLAIGSGYLLANLYKTDGNNFKLEFSFTLLHFLSTLILIPQPANKGMCRLWLMMGVPWMAASLCNMEREDWTDATRPWAMVIKSFSIIWMLTTLVIAASDDYQALCSCRKKVDTHPLVRYPRSESLHIDTLGKTYESNFIEAGTADEVKAYRMEKLL